jgi:hypothetical protein
MIPQTTVPPPGTSGVQRKIYCSSGFANSTRTFNETKFAVSKMNVFCDNIHLSANNSFGLHCGVWGVDWLSRHGYNVSVVMAPLRPR